MERKFTGRHNLKSGFTLTSLYVYITGFLLFINATDSSFGVAAPACVRSWDAAKGFCRPLSECPDVGPHGIYKTRKPDLCEPYGQMPIVCCVPKEPITKNDAVQALSLASPIRESMLPSESISRQKCREYAKLVSAPIEDILGNSQQCVQSRRHSGPAEIGEFPHMAALFNGPIESEERFVCGGTLISERYVLSTAHCVRGDRNDSTKWVLLGSLGTNLDKTDPKRQMIRVSQIIPHPDYKPSELYFDVGLVQLASNARLGPDLRPACIPSDRDTSSLYLTITGWGFTQQGGIRSKQLLKARVVQAPFEVCNQTYGSIPHLPLGVHNGSILCAGRPDASLVASGGDGGGPLTAISSDFTCMYELVGVITFGRLWGTDAKVPNGYARVSFYRNWIEDIVWS